MSPRGSLWPDISNRLARLAVAAMFNRTPIDAEDWDYDPVLLNETSNKDARITSGITPSELRVYRYRLRQLLPSTGIAQNLLDQWYHDGFYDALPEGVAFWYRIFRPRDIERLVVHVSKHLGWYIDRTKPYSLRDLVIPPLLTLGGTVWFGILMFFAFIPGVSSIAVAIAVLASLAIVNIIRTRAANQTMYTNLTSAINTAEFYLYLRDAYRDVD